MKGAPLPPIGRSNTALVLHDMQNDFIKASLVQTRNASRRAADESSH